MAVRDSDGYLPRVSYYLHIIGTLEKVALRPGAAGAVRRSPA